MSLLRPTCASLARRLCTAQPLSEPTLKSPLLALIQRHRSSRPRCRAFVSTPRYRARVIDTPQNPSIPQSRKRTVRIGPLPEGPVSEPTIHRIFGRKLSGHDGNNVLRILHHRRTAGSLADYGVDNLGKQYTHVSRDTALKGLEWLREKYPIDEARAAEEWAEKEANRIAYELWLADPETESKYKDPARAFREQMEKEEAERIQQEADNRKIGILHAGKSQFELNIEEKRRQRLEEITRKAEEKEQQEREMEEKLATGEYVRTPTGTQLMKPGQTAYVDVFGREQVSRRKEEMEKYSKAAVITDAKTEEELLAQTTLVSTLSPLPSARHITNTIAGATSLPHVRLRLPHSPNLLRFRPLLPPALALLPPPPRPQPHNRHHRRVAGHKRRYSSSMARYAPLAHPNSLLHARPWLPARRPKRPQRLQPRPVRASPRQHDDALSRRPRMLRPRWPRHLHGNVYLRWCRRYFVLSVLG